MVDFDGRSTFDQVKRSPLWSGNESRFAASEVRAYNGRRSGRADLAGHAESTTKYARGIFNVKWGLGTEVSIGAAFYLPRGFLRDVQGHVTLMRWDNWDAYSRGITRGAFDRTGVMIFGSDDRLRLIYMDDEFRQLTPSFRISEGRWHWIEVPEVRSHLPLLGALAEWQAGRKVAAPELRLHPHVRDRPCPLRPRRDLGRRPNQTPSPVGRSGVGLG